MDRITSISPTLLLSLTTHCPQRLIQTGKRGKCMAQRAVWPRTDWNQKWSKNADKQVPAAVDDRWARIPTFLAHCHQAHCMRSATDVAIYCVIVIAIQAFKEILLKYNVRNNSHGQANPSTIRQAGDMVDYKLQFSALYAYIAYAHIYHTASANDNR